jgi:hypothetical protein
MPPARATSLPRRSFVRYLNTRDPWEATRFATLLASHSVERAGLEGNPDRPRDRAMQHGRDTVIHNYQSEIVNPKS